MSTFFKLAVVAAALSLVACADEGRIDPPITDDDDAGAVPEGGTPPPADRPDGSIVSDAGGQGDSGLLFGCGNRIVDQGEQCDDGNRVSGDGCTSECVLESAVEGDLCPGNVIPLTQEGTYLHGAVSGTTVGAYNHYGSACGGGSGADVVYSFTPTTSGKAIVRFAADYLGIVSARSDCSASNSEMTCGALVEPSTETTFELPVFANTPAFVHVDGYAGASGAFDLEVEISLAACGNGVAELPERCDDGNVVDGDGCSATCSFEQGGIVDKCPGQPFPLSGPEGAPRVISVAGNTLGGADEEGSTCFFNGGAENVYAIQSDIDGSAHVELTAGYLRASLYVRRECSFSDYLVDCDAREPLGPLSLDVPVRAGEWFYVLVDSERDYGGPFTATVTVEPALCRNGKNDGNEGCDDGNVVDGDGCSTTCTVEADAAADTCGGHAIQLTADAEGVLRGIRSGANANRVAKVPYCFDWDSDKVVTPPRPSPNEPAPPPYISPDQPGDSIYVVTAPINGRLEVNLRDSHRGIVSILSSEPCEQRSPLGALGRLANVLDCSLSYYRPRFGTDPWNLEGIGGEKTVSTTVVAGQSYYVVVDAAGERGGMPTEGPFTVVFAIAPAVCGNDALDGAEECDDGNLDDGDGCSATCTVEPNLPDTCASAAAMTFAEAAGVHTATARGNTTNLAANQEFGSTATGAGNCSAPGPDGYYRVVTPAAGVMRITARSSQFDVVLGLRNVCVTNTSPLSCSNGGAVGDETLERAVEPGEEYWVVVDSPGIPAYSQCTADGFTPACDHLLERGMFDLSVTVSPSVCGDGFYAAGSNEQCDDGNLVDGDGCSATCQAEPLASVDTCPGYTLPLVQTQNGYRGVVAVDTSDLTANYSGACGGNAPEGVVRVTAPITGTLRAKASNLDGVTVYARAVCNDPATEFRKTTSSSCSTVVHDTVTFQVTATDEYFLFVDGLTAQTGVPTLEVIVTP